jgi:hypothetical protein
MKKTLAMMSGIEARQHYDTLNYQRTDRARLTLHTAVMSRDRKLVGFANDALDKARRLGEPRQMWQLEAARERKEKYGVAVAAGYMAANGWSVEAALHTLLGK